MAESQADKFYRLAKEQQPAVAAENAAPPQRRGMFKRIALYVLATYMLVCAGVFFFRDRVIFRPQPEKSLLPRDFGFAAQQAQALELTVSDGTALRGWHIAGRYSKNNTPAPRLADAHLVALYFCDRGGNRGERTEHLRRLAGQGAHVVCFDYRGFGDSAGAPSPALIHQDARAVWEFVRGHGVPANMIVLQGHGLGAAVAAQLAAALCTEKTSPGGLVLEAPFAQVADVLAPQWPLVPVGVLVGTQFNTAAALQAVNCFTLIFRGGQDTVLSATAAQQLLAPFPPGLATLVELPGCNRDDVGVQDANILLDEARLFYRRVCPQLAITFKRADTEAPAREPRARERKKRNQPDDSAKKP